MPMVMLVVVVVVVPENVVIADGEGDEKERRGEEMGGKGPACWV
jgi:hypothetical protein